MHRAHTHVVQRLAVHQSIVKPIIPFAAPQKPVEAGRVGGVTPTLQMKQLGPRHHPDTKRWGGHWPQACLSWSQSSARSQNSPNMPTTKHTWHAWDSPLTAASCLLGGQHAWGRWGRSGEWGERTLRMRSLSSECRGQPWKLQDPKSLDGQANWGCRGLRWPQSLELIGPQGSNPRTQRTCP